MDDELRQRILGRRWFYEFELPDGSRTESYLPPEVLPIHTSRERMLLEHLDLVLGDDWSSSSCLDLACHEGYYAVLLGRRGFGRVLGVDARAAHVEHATLMARAFGLDAVDFRRGDLETREWADGLAPFDVTLLFGVLYHLRDLSGVLRTARELTREILVIETQVASDLSGELEWGSASFTKPIMGCLAIVDEAEELRSGNQEAGVSDVSLVPSLRGLLWLLERAGFRDARVLDPPPGAYEQLARGRRVMLSARSG